MSERANPHLVMKLRGLALRMQGRVEAIEDRDGREGSITGRGIGIGYLLTRDLAQALSDAADFIERSFDNADANLPELVEKNHE